MYIYVNIFTNKNWADKAELNAKARRKSLKYRLCIHKQCTWFKQKTTAVQMSDRTSQKHLETVK